VRHLLAAQVICSNHQAVQMVLQAIVIQEQVSLGLMMPTLLALRKFLLIQVMFGKFVTIHG
jgi:hypothetical protein